MKEKVDIYSFIYQNKDTEYVKRLFNLFKKDMGILKNIPMLSVIDSFVEWIRYKKDMGKEFAKQIDDDFVILPYNIAEIGKGPLDTISDTFIHRGYNVTAISPDARSYDNNVIRENGNLIFDVGEGFITSESKIIPLSNVSVDALITTLPSNDKTVHSMICNSLNGYGCLIGTYNDKEYGNYKEDIAKFKALKEYIQSQTDLKIKVYDQSLGSQNYNALYVDGIEHHCVKSRCR